MQNSFVSVVVCTYNRGKYLRRCLSSLKRQSYQNYEIIVVNGPSSDETDTILESHPDVRIVRQETLNGLSYARNLGIRAAKGDIIAFIDDDAVADENWLFNLVLGYTDDTVGGVGGLVYGPEKTHFQFDNGTINKSGIPKAIRPLDKKLKWGEFQILMGTNCSFKRDALYCVGGFDPYFKYYHDESDLCVRIAQHGYRILYQRDAFVGHDMAEGHNRKSPYDLNWSEILKNVVYFTLRNFHGEIRSYTIRPVYSTLWWLLFFQLHFINSRIPLKQLIHIYRQLFSGVVRGYKDGLNPELNKNFIADSNSNLVDETASSISSKGNFRFTGLVDNSDRLKIALLSQEYVKDGGGGICRYTYDLAHGLADLENEVHVVTKSKTDVNYDYMDGDIFVHAVAPQSIDFLDLSFLMRISRANLSYSYAVCLRLLELIDSHGIQIVEAPIWDAEGFVFSLFKPVPFVVSLHTPLFKVVEVEGRRITRDLIFANWLEGEMVRRADKVIANSKAISTLICGHHNISEDNITIIPHGIDLSQMHTVIENSSSCSLSETLPNNVLFVGRLEKRKGIDTLIEAIPAIVDRVPNVRFTIVGGDTNLSPLGGSYKKYLLKKLNNKYHQYVDFKGFVPDVNLHEYYRKCDVFVAPSLYESFGLIYLEAMAWGKPVIGCHVGGVPEVIADGETGIIIPPEDAKALAEAVSFLLTDVQRREEMGGKSIKWVKNRYTKEIMAERSLGVYLKCWDSANCSGGCH